MQRDENFEWKEDMLAEQQSKAHNEVRFAAYYGYNNKDRNPNKRLYVSVDKKDVFDNHRHQTKLPIPTDPVVVKELGNFLAALSKKLEVLNDTSVTGE